MANSTYMDTVNRCLYHAGQAPIPGSTEFADPTKLSRAQLQAKLFVDKANRGLIRSMRGRFLKRKYTFNTSSVSNSYNIDSTTSLENLVEDSMFRTTAGKGGQIEYIPYETWLTWFPSGESTKGIPNFWFDYPPDGTGVDKIGFSPPPNGTIAIQYEGYLDPVVLSAYNDVIQWPSKFEDLLWDYAQVWIEMSLSEGKMEQIGVFLDPLFAQVRQLSLGPIDKPPSVSLGMKLGGIRKGGQRSAYSPTL